MRRVHRRCQGCAGRHVVPARNSPHHVTHDRPTRCMQNHLKFNLSQLVISGEKRSANVSAWIRVQLSQFPATVTSKFIPVAAGASQATKRDECFD
jgi:hypothetical protein